jgi:hypothetical protein
LGDDAQIPGTVTEVEDYPGQMATLRSMRPARALTVGLVSAGVLAGTMLAGPAGPASASALANIPVFEDPAPTPPTDPAPKIDTPANQGPTNYEAPQTRHHRHIGDPVR